MDSTTQELQQRAEEEQTNETPELDDGADDAADVDDASSGAGLVPTPDRKVMIGAAVVGALVIAYLVYRQAQDGASGRSGSLDDATGDGLSATSTIEDEEEGDGKIHVPADGDPTEKDGAVVAAFRERGRLQSKED